MLQTIAIGIGILFVAILLMGIRVFFTRKGEFPNTHIRESEAMRKRGIGCATSQDREAFRRENPLSKILSEN